MRLENKIALVTGASKGIGASIAKHLGGAGATVVVNYSASQSGADKTVAEIVAAGGKATAIQGDFSKREDITRVFAVIKQQHGKLDILVNNAGVYSFGPVEEVSPEEFHRQFNLNVLGVLLATGEASKLMSAGGTVINLGSVVGSMPMPFSSIYSATKGAVDNLTISLSKELGARKIRVNAINPGLIETEGALAVGTLEGDFHDFMLRTTPLGRIGLPDDIGPVAVFLSSDDAHWVTGQRILVGGGHTN